MYLQLAWVHMDQTVPLYVLMATLVMDVVTNALALALNGVML